MLTYTITPRDHCLRFEGYLRSLMPQAPAGYVRKLIKNGAVRLNGAAAGIDTPIFTSDIVVLKESAALTAQLAASPLPLDVLYEDDRIAIINKVAGLPMHRTAEREPNLVDSAAACFSGVDKFYPVNRIDRGTSGAVILAKSSSSAGIYGRHVKENGLDKLYLALVRGIPEMAGLIDTPLDDKESVTRFRMLQAGDGAALLAVVPVSGRMHQIRRHLQMTGHPVLGDKRYGGGECAGYAGFCLHSFRTVLERPGAGPLTVCAPFPYGLLEVCSRFSVMPDRVLERLKLIVTGKEQL